MVGVGEAGERRGYVGDELLSLSLSGGGGGGGVHVGGEDILEDMGILAREGARADVRVVLLVYRHVQRARVQRAVAEVEHTLVDHQLDDVCPPDAQQRRGPHREHPHVASGDREA